MPKKSKPKKRPPKKAVKTKSRVLPAAQRLTKAELKQEFTEAKAEAIIQKGKDRGFLTYSEILSVFPHIEYNVVFLEDLYARLEAAGVDVLEGRELLELPKPRAEEDTSKLSPAKKRARERALLRQSAENLEISAVDSVQMYLKE